MLVRKFLIVRLIVGRRWGKTFEILNLEENLKGNPMGIPNRFVFVKLKPLRTLKSELLPL